MAGGGRSRAAVDRRPSRVSVKSATTWSRSSPVMLRTDARSSSASMISRSSMASDIRSSARRSSPVRRPIPCLRRSTRSPLRVVVIRVSKVGPAQRSAVRHVCSVHASSRGHRRFRVAEPWIPILPGLTPCGTSIGPQISKVPISIESWSSGPLSKRDELEGDGVLNAQPLADASLQPSGARSPGSLVASVEVGEV